MSDLIVHPYAESFPMLAPEALKAIADDIKSSGQIPKIAVRKSDGMLLDGRNRIAACKLAGVEPEIEIHDVDELATLHLIRRLNMHRRHMSPSERGKAAAEYAERLEKILQELNDTASFNSEKKEPKAGKPITVAAVANKEAAKEHGVTARTVQRARKQKADDAKPKPIIVTETPAKPIDGKPNDPKDKLGQPIPKELWQVFVTQRFGDIKGAFDTIRSVIKLLLNESAGFHVNKHVSATEKYLIPGLDSIRYQLIDDGEPYCVCITCNGTGKVRIDACKSCKGCGWLTKYKWRQIKDDAEAEASIRK